MIIIKTTDGGQNWSLEYSSLGSTGLYGLDLFDAYNGWSVGVNGNIIRKKADPTITSINPSTANQGDTNLLVTLQGTNFLTGLATTSVTFSLSGITVNSLTRDSDSQLSLLISVSTTGATGIGNITLTNPDGGSIIETNAFSVNPAGVIGPSVTSIVPNMGGCNATNMPVVINGSNYHLISTPEVYFRNGGITVNDIPTWSATAITCDISIAGTAAATWRGVTVTNPDDGGIGSKNNIFKVNNAPLILSVTELPAASAVYAGTTKGYYVTGLYFQTGASASFSPTDITVGSVTVDDSEHLTLTATISSTATDGAHTLTVTNLDFGNGSLASALTVQQQATTPGVVQERCLAGPNPWNPLTNPNVTLQVYLTADTQIKLTLFTIDGEKLDEITFSGVAGYNSVTWDGLTLTGLHVPEGIFLVNIVDVTRGTTLGNINVMVHRYL